MGITFPSLSYQLRQLNIRPTVPPKDLGRRLRQLLGYKTDRPMQATFASVEPSPAVQKRASARIRQVASTHGLALKRKDIGKRRKLPAQMNEEALASLLRLGRAEDSRGDIVAGAEIGRQVLHVIENRADIVATKIRLDASQLILDGGEENRPGAAEWMIGRQHLMTRDLYQFGDLFKAAQSASTEGLLARTHAMTFTAWDRQREIHIKQAIRHTRSASDLLLSIKPGSFTPAHMIFMRGQACYLRSRFLIELDEPPVARKEMFELIELAEVLDDARLWTDSLRCFTLYHLYSKNVDEAAEALSYLCYYFDQLPNPSVYTFLAIIFRLTEYALATRGQASELVAIFQEYWRRFPVVYIGDRGRELFSRIKQDNGDWLPAYTPERFAARCSNFQRV